MTMNYITWSVENSTIGLADDNEEFTTLALTSVMKFFYLFIPSFGIPGNLFATFVMLSSAEMCQKPCNLFMIHQSIIDLLACVCTFVTQFYDDVTFNKDPSLAEDLFCHLFLSLGVMWSIVHVSGYNLMALTLERYWAIKKPLKYDSNEVKRRLPYTFILSWLVGFASLFPNFATTRIVDGKCLVHYDIKSPILFNLMTPYFFCVACGIPGTVMMYSYIAIGLSLRKSQEFTKNDNTATTKKSKLKKAQMNLLQTCVLLMILFFMCWIQLTIVFFLYTVGYYTFLYTKYFHIAVFCLILNSCLNPYIYSARYNEFKEQVRYLYSRIVATQTGCIE